MERTKEKVEDELYRSDGFALLEDHSVAFAAFTSVFMQPDFSVLFSFDVSVSKDSLPTDQRFSCRMCAIDQGSQIHSMFPLLLEDFVIINPSADVRNHRCRTDTIRIISDASFSCKVISVIVTELTSRSTRSHQNWRQKGYHTL